MNIIEFIKKNFNLCKNNKAMKNLKTFNNDSKNIEEGSRYPTEQEYEENVNNIRRNELQSERFIKTKEFIHNYNRRGNLELEKELFEIVGTYGLEKELFGKEYEYIKANKEKRYSKLIEFLLSLTADEIASNIYLNSALKILESSTDDCKTIINQLESKISSLDLSDEWKRIEITIDIPKEKYSLFPERISEEASTPYFRPHVYKVSYVKRLDENNQYVYKEYNDYVYKMDKLSEDIYDLQIWNLLSKLSVDIKSSHFSIWNNSFEHKFNVSFIVRKSKQNIVENSKINVEKNSDGKPTCNLRLIIDGIPIDEENIFLIEDTDNEFDKLSDKTKVIVKVKK